MSRLYEAGASVQQVADAAGIDFGRAYRTLRRSGTVMRRRGRPSANKRTYAALGKEVLADLQTGDLPARASTTEVASWLGVPHNTAYLLLRRLERLGLVRAERPHVAILLVSAI